MGSKSDAFENLLLNHTFGGVSWAAPGTVYVGLWTSALADDSTGETAGEANYTSYARVATATGTASWTAASGGTVKNAAVVTFPEAGGDQSGTVTYFGVLNASAAGTLLYHGQLTTGKTIATGDTPRFSANSLVITES